MITQQSRPRTVSALLFTVLLFAAPVAQGRIIPKDPKPEIQACEWVAIVKVVAISEDQLTVQVTDNPDKIYRGFKYLGRELRIISPPPPEGHTELLLCVRSNREVIYMGFPDDEGVTPAVRFVKPFFVLEKRFPPVIRKLPMASGRMPPRLTAAELAEITKTERADFYKSVAQELVAPSMPITPAECSELITRLNSPKFAEREQATGSLLRAGPSVLPSLREALISPLPPEARQRVRRLVAAISDAEPGYPYAVQVRASGTCEEARVLIKVLEMDPDDKLSASIVARLRTLGRNYLPSHAIPADANREVILAAWREYLSQPTIDPTTQNP